MAKKISQLTQITNIDASTYVPVVQGVGAAADDYKMLPSDFYKTETNARIAADNTNYNILHGEIISEQSDRIAADDEIKSDINDLQSIFKYSNTETYFIFVGDSRTDDEKPGGYPSTMTPYPNILMQLPNFLNKGVKVNAAVWGEDIQQAFDGYPTRVYPYRPNSTTIKDAYLFFMIGINDLTFGNDLLPTIQNKIDKYIEYCTRATNDGFKVVALTSFYTDYLTSQKEADRIKFNNAIINNAPNVFLTVDTDMLMGKDTTSIFWADVLHQSHAGSRLIADFINAQFSPGNKMLSFRSAPQLPHEIKIVDGQVRIGTSTNYSYFDENGMLHMVGSSSVFDDLIGDITAVKTIGTRVSLNSTENTIDFTNQATLSDYAFISFQLPHKWKIGSTLYPHIHWEQAEDNTPNWLIQYRWQKQGGTKTTAWTNYKSNVNAFTYVSVTTNQISHNGGFVPPVGAGLSDIIQIRLIRDTSNASGLFTGTTPYSGTASVTSIDIHYEIDSLGSNQEYVK